MSKRNVVLISLDSVRANHCSFMGYSRGTTPTIDKMARNGLIFKNAISPSYSTLPSMKAIFTGMFFNQNSAILKDVRDQLLKEFKTQTTLAEVFRQNGYYTIGFTPNAWTSSYFGFNKGFNYFRDSFSSGGFTSKLYELLFGRLDKSKFFSILRNIKNLIFREEVFSTWEKYYHTILSQVERVNKPFLLWVFLTDTHIPYYCPKRYRKWSNLVDMDITNNIYTWKLEKNNFIMEIPEKARRVLINAYDDSIRYADLFVKRLWNDLEDYDPIFVIHADHGEGFNEHGFYGHYHPFLYEENIHVPFIIYNADIVEKVEKPVSLINLSSAVSKLIEQEINFSAEDIENIFNNGLNVVISKAFGRDGKLRVSVRLNDWKLIMGQKNIDELYNLKQDPGERCNLINEHSKLAEEMRVIARKHIKREAEIKEIRAAIQRWKK